MAGRPSKYTKALATKICTLLAEGESLRSVCAMEGMPNKSTVIRWLASNEDFCDQYARAKEQAAFLMAEDILEIADDGSNDWMEKLDGEGNAVGYQLNGEHVQRSKLRVDARKWLLSKLLPKKFGEKVALTGEGGGPIQTVNKIERTIVRPKSSDS